MSIGSGVPIAIEPGQIVISAAFANGRIPTFFLTDISSCRPRARTRPCAVEELALGYDDGAMDAPGPISPHVCRQAATAGGRCVLDRKRLTGQP